MKRLPHPHPKAESHRGNLYILTGIPGSGKSTAGTAFGKLYSSDEIRQELFGNAALQYEINTLAGYVLDHQLDLDSRSRRDRKAETDKDRTAAHPGKTAAHRKRHSRSSERARPSDGNIQDQGKQLEKIVQELNGYPERRLAGMGNRLVFAELDLRVMEGLDRGEDVVYDATSLTRDKRRSLLDLFQGHYDKTYCVFVDTPLEVALERNQKRERQVPESVIRKMYEDLEKPETEEGFDSVYIIRPDGTEQIS